MKSTFSILVFLFCCSFTYAQLESIKEFPKAYESQEVTELTPVWITENEILVFYTVPTLDTLYSRRTTDSGQTWSEQKTEQHDLAKGNQDKLYISTIKGDDSRIFLAWSDISTKIIFSDDKGNSWNQTPGLPSITSSYLNFAKLYDGRISLTYKSYDWKFLISEDNGYTWVAENSIEIPVISFLDRSFSIISIGQDSLLGIFTGINGFGSAYSMFSTDGGNTWSDTSLIFIGNFPVGSYPKLRVTKYNSGNLYLIIDKINETVFGEYNQKDVSVLTSSNNGITWTELNSFTKYLGDDSFENLTTLGDEIFITFNSARSSEEVETYYGIFGESEDIFTPPVLVKQEVVGVDYEINQFDYRAFIIDNDDIFKVSVELGNGEFIQEMFDDGVHNDSLAGDHIYGNAFPILPHMLRRKNYSLDVNKIRLPMDNKGRLASVNYDGLEISSNFIMYDNDYNSISDSEITVIPVTNPGAGARYEEGSFLFAGGFFLSGYNSIALWSNGVEQVIQDYLPGKVRSNPNEEINKLYIVNKNDIPFGYSWQNWRNAVLLGADFYDGDHNGIYNPVDKNWNGTRDINEDMPALIGNEIIFCVYNDAIPKELRRWNTIDPQGIEIRQTVFASDLPDLENVIFIKYSILNTGTVAELMDSVYFGIWEDGDLGDHIDDVVGCDTLLNSGFYYNTVPDWVYGDNCPSFFTTLLQGPISETNGVEDTAHVNYGSMIGYATIAGAKNLEMSSHVFFIGGDSNLNHPNNKTEARYYLEGKTKFGDYIDLCNDMHFEIRGGISCNDVNPLFWASGDPVTNIGWFNKLNVNQYNMLSTGPFKLEKGEPQDIIIAYVIGRGTDPINSITVARKNVRRAIAEYESNFASMTYTPPPPTAPITNYILYHNYPNPFNPTTTIRYELPQDGIVTIAIYDILGQKVKTILTEFKQADRYEVRFDASGLASGVYIYSMKVNDFIESKKMILLR